MIIGWVEEGDEDALVRAVARPFRASGLSLGASPDDSPGARPRRGPPGPPLVVGITEDGGFLSSDQLGVLPRTGDVVFLKDGDVARVDGSRSGRRRRRGRPGRDDHRLGPGRQREGAYPHMLGDPERRT